MVVVVFVVVVVVVVVGCLLIVIIGLALFSPTQAIGTRRETELISTNEMER